MGKNVHELVNSISKSAKRYCHLQLKSFHPNSAENLYLEDFLNIESGKETQLKSNQTRLYEKLLDILYQYYETNANVKQHETRNIQRSLVLNSLGLYQEATKLNDKAIQLSLQNKNYIKYFEAFDQRMKFAFDNDDQDYFAKFISTDKDKKETFMREYLNLVDYQTLWAKLKVQMLNYDIQQYTPSPEEQILLSGVEKALTIDARILFYKINGLLCKRKNKFEEALQYMLEINAIYQEDSLLLEKEPLEYAKFIKSLCIVLCRLNKFNDISVILKVAEDNHHYCDGKNDNIQLEVKFVYIGIVMDLILYSNNYDFDIEKMNRWETIWLDNFDRTPLDSRMYLAYKFFLINLHLKNYRKCKRFLNFILNFKDTVFIKDVREMAVLGELTTHYLEGDYDLFKSRLRSAENSFSDGKNLFSYTPNIISMFKLMSKDFNSKSYMPVLQDLIKKVEEGDWTVYVNVFALKELAH